MLECGSHFSKQIGKIKYKFQYIKDFKIQKIDFINLFLFFCFLLIKNV